MHRIVHILHLRRELIIWFDRIIILLECQCLTTNCSNNYGPYQFPEKLIPLMILNALEGKNLPIYGDGANIRDWLHVEDHCRGIFTVLEKGRVGETYCIGGDSEKTNLEVVDTICKHWIKIALKMHLMKN